MTTANGAGIITGVANLIGGANYSSATTASVVDDNGLGPGSGAVPVLTITGGVITAIAFSSGGENYVYPELVINDPTNSGSGASATLTVDNSAMFTASAPVFSLTDVGSVIRCGYGVAVITSYVSPTQVIANIISPITQLQPDNPIDPDKPQKFLNGTWTMTAPITELYLPVLAGFGDAERHAIRPAIPRGAVT